LAETLPHRVGPAYTPVKKELKAVSPDKRENKKITFVGFKAKSKAEGARRTSFSLAGVSRFDDSERKDSFQGIKGRLGWCVIKRFTSLHCCL